VGKRVPAAIKERVINEWLQAKPRNDISFDMEISYGTVTNIIDEAKRDSIKDMDLLRAVAVLLKKKNLDLTQFASSIRLKNKLDSLKISEEIADSFLEDAVIYCFKEEIEPDKFFSQISSVCFISEFYNIPLEKLPMFIESAKEKNDQGK